jgi:hypothetical protein
MAKFRTQTTSRNCWTIRKAFQVPFVIVTSGKIFLKTFAIRSRCDFENSFFDNSFSLSSTHFWFSSTLNYSNKTLIELNLAKCLTIAASMSNIIRVEHHNFWRSSNNFSSISIVKQSQVERSTCTLTINYRFLI